MTPLEKKLLEGLELAWKWLGTPGVDRPATVDKEILDILETGRALDTAGESIVILAQARPHPTSQLTKGRLEQDVFYVRENTVNGQNVLELCAPENRWQHIANIITLEDSLKRSVFKSDLFTAEWAEKELARAKETPA